jgi:PAS domain S-box-containing protein
MTTKTESHLKFVGYAVLVVAGLLVSIIMGLYLLQKTQIGREVDASLKSAENLLHFHVDKDTEIINALLDQVTENPELKDAWNKHDRKILLAKAEPIYWKANRDFRITHFYFHDANGVNFLRVHAPARFGDDIDRISLKKAMKTGKPASALELGPLGTFTLRIVYPWRDNGRIIGYIEMGEEVGHVLQSLKTTLGNDWLLTLNKEWLDRAGWETGAGLVGSRSKWDDFKSIVVVQSTFSENMAEFGKILGSPQPSKKSDLEIEIGLRRYRVDWVPLGDAGRGEVGKLYIFVDVTEQQMITRRLFATMILIGLLGIMGVIAFFVFSLSRQKRLLHSMHLENLLSESKKREEEREQHVTQIEEAKEALSRQTQLLGSILDAIPTPITYKDSDGLYLGCNSAYTDFFGLSPEDLRGKKPEDVFHGDDGVIEQEADRAVLEKGGRITYEMKVKDLSGNRKDLFASKASFHSPDGRTEGIVGAMFDITQQKEVETQLREREERLRSIFSNAMDGIYACDPSGKFISANPALCKMLGYTEEDLAELTLTDVTHPEDRKQSSLALTQVLTGNRQTANIETRLLSKRGEVVHVRLTASWVFDERKNPQLTIGIVHDVTQEKASEEDRRRLITAVTQADEGIVVTGPDGVILFVNPAFERITGYTSEEAVGQKTDILKSGLHSREFYENLWRTIRGGRVWRGGFTNKKKNGDVYKERCTISPVRDDSGRIANYVAVKQDISRETELEDQLRQAQKMEAVGTLAGGVAHDFNNLLQVISGCTQLMSHTLEDKPENAYLERVSSAVDRGADLVNRILTFSRPSPQEIHTFSINLNIANALKMLEQALPKNIVIENFLASGLSPINGVPDQIEQIVINLATNARDAMPGGGTIRVTTANVPVSTVLEGEVKGPFVRLLVEDNGHGIPKEIRDRIFEPFFTTKEVGKGTGLGLYTVYNIVRNHDGEIFCHALPGGGTSFEILFPVAAERRRQVREELPIPASRLPEGKENILIVDDEPAILMSTRELLELRGFKTLGALSGEEALRIFSAGWENIDLVMADLGMPGMGGIELIGELKKLNPKVKIIIASGYAENTIDEEMKGLRSYMWVRKPFRFDKLVLSVREALDS